MSTRTGVMESQHQAAMIAIQREMCARYGLPDTPVEDTVALATGTLGQMPIYGTRVEPGDGDNISWFFHCGKYSDADNFYQPVHTEHLPQMLPFVVKYLRLSPGTHFIIDDRGYEDVWHAPS